jgi:hypothetical protein
MKHYYDEKIKDEMGRVCSRLKKEEKNTHTHTPVSMNV